MNRHDRRAAAAKVRKPGYQERIMTAMQDKIGKPGVAMAAVFHDSWCDMYQGRPCNCDPDISIQEYDKSNSPTDEVIIVDRDGQAERVKKA